MTDLETSKRTELYAHEHEHIHADGTRHTHAHAQGVGHVHRTPTLVEINASILEKNDRLAERNRAWLAGRQVLALNLMSAPGAGKTRLLESTLARLKDGTPPYVLEGDQASELDGERVRAAGARALQVNTGRGCHLDAEMVARALTELNPPAHALLFIENVGNLVCPALFDLGEHRRIAILSVTEGDDKPLKYPHMFRAAHLLLINKIDLLGHVDFVTERAIAHARSVNPALETLLVSAKTGEGIDRWLDWIEQSRDLPPLSGR